MANKCGLYRMYDQRGDLLYVGISVNPFYRFEQHRATKDWFRAVTTLTIEWHPSRRIALDAETAAIKAELPRFNLAQVDQHRYWEDPRWITDDSPEWLRLVALEPRLEAFRPGKDMGKILRDNDYCFTRTRAAARRQVAELVGWHRSGWCGNDIEESWLRTDRAYEIALGYLDALFDECPAPCCYYEPAMDDLLDMPTYEEL